MHRTDRHSSIVIQVLTRMSKSYEEAIKYLRERYDCSRLVQEEHICSIVNALPDKEIRHLYDAATEHYGAFNVANGVGLKHCW